MPPPPARPHCTIVAPQNIPMGNSNVYSGTYNPSSRTGFHGSPHERCVTSDSAKKIEDWQDANANTVVRASTGFRGWVTKGPGKTCAELGVNDPYITKL